jgi:hypothetical protein
MRKLVLDILVVDMMLGVAALALEAPSNAQYEITAIMDYTGDGGDNSLRMGQGVAVDPSRNVYVTSWATHVAFKIRPGLRVPVLSNGGLAVLGVSLVFTVLWLARRRRLANA